MKKEICPPEAVDMAYQVFLHNYQQFRKTNGLGKKIKNVHEILTAMTDKHGRICRYIKHQERKDPKSNWQKELSSSLTGYIVYSILLMEHYGLDISEGMLAELGESLKQHGEKTKQQEIKKDHAIYLEDLSQFAKEQQAHNTRVYRQKMKAKAICLECGYYNNSFRNRYKCYCGPECPAYARDHQGK